MVQLHGWLNAYSRLWDLYGKASGQHLVNSLLLSPIGWWRTLSPLALSCPSVSISPSWRGLESTSERILFLLRCVHSDFHLFTKKHFPLTSTRCTWFLVVDFTFTHRIVVVQSFLCYHQSSNSAQLWIFKHSILNNIPCGDILPLEIFCFDSLSTCFYNLLKSSYPFICHFPLSPLNSHLPWLVLDLLINFDWKLSLILYVLLIVLCK